MTREQLVQAVYAIFVRAAEAGAPCPTPHEIAEQVGCSRALAQGITLSMTRRGFLRMCRPRDRAFYVVVTATGQQTGVRFYERPSDARAAKPDDEVLRDDGSRWPSSFAARKPFAVHDIAPERSTGVWRLSGGRLVPAQAW